MKTIDQMSLEELQAYALELEGKTNTLTEQQNAANAKISDLQDLNTALQKRNNDLLMRVEQKQPDPQPQPDPTPKTESYEDFAKRILSKGV